MIHEGSFLLPDELALLDANCGITAEEAEGDTNGI